LQPNLSPSRPLPGGSDDTYEKGQHSQSVSQPNFEAGKPRPKVMIFSAWANMIGW